MSDMIYDDGMVNIVVLGGVNKKTGKKNPTELLGFYLRKDSIKTKYGVKPFYIFKTETGTDGIIGGGNLNKLMETKAVGAFTHVIDTGEVRDVGKGNPMKVYRVGQNLNNRIDVASEPVSSVSYPSSEPSYSDDEVSGLQDEEQEIDQAPKTISQRGRALPPTSEQQAKVAAMLANRQKNS